MSVDEASLGGMSCRGRQEETTDPNVCGASPALSHPGHGPWSSGRMGFSFSPQAGTEPHFKRHDRGREWPVSSRFLAGLRLARTRAVHPFCTRHSSGRLLAEGASR